MQERSGVNFEFDWTEQKFKIAAGDKYKLIDVVQKLCFESETILISVNQWYEL